MRRLILVAVLATALLIAFAGSALADGPYGYPAGSGYMSGYGHYDGQPYYPAWGQTYNYGYGYSYGYNNCCYCWYYCKPCAAPRQTYTYPKPYWGSYMSYGW